MINTTKEQHYGEVRGVDGTHPSPYTLQISGIRLFHRGERHRAALHHAQCSLRPSQALS